MHTTAGATPKELMMTYLNPVQTAIEWILDHDVPDDQFADALAAQLEFLVGDQEPEPPVALH